MVKTLVAAVDRLLSRRHAPALMLSALLARCAKHSAAWKTIASASLLLSTALFHSAALAGPIHDAAKAGDVEEIERLLAADIDVDERDVAKKTALHWAADAGYIEVVEVLIAGGADVDAADFSGVTALHNATYSGHEAIALLLVEHGADVNAINSDGETPLDHAARMGLARTVETLKGAGAECGHHPDSCYSLV